MDMKTYIGVKIIDATPMNLGEYNKYRGWKIPDDEDPEREGYLVKYPDDYKSWSPKEVFEEAYVEYHEDTLPTTAKDMISSDYKERFKAEYNQLVIRYNGLRNMLDKWDAGELNFTPTCDRSIYDDQLKAMQSYINVLKQRSALEKIKVNCNIKDTVPILQPGIKIVDMDDFQQLCREIVRDYTNEHMDKSYGKSITIDDTYIVWSNKSLQNFKALVSTNVSDGMYYELTYNGDKKEIYLDAYKKFENKCIREY